LLFYTSDWGDRELDEIVTANDTAVSWWRAQQLSSAFADATARAFRDWADEQGVAFGLDEALNNSLFAAHMNAHLTGEYGAALATGSLLARNTLLMGTVDGEDRRADALNDLRLSGDARSVEQAACHLWATGPLPPLANAARQIQPSSWTHTTARANLTLWEHAGDLLDEPAANDAARYCLAVVRDGTEFSARVTPSFAVAFFALNALAGVLPAAGDAVHTEVAKFLSSLPPTNDEADARGLARVASNLRSSALAADVRGALRDTATAQPHRALSAAILGAIADIDEDARTLLVNRVREGDQDALGALGNISRLTSDTARELADHLVQKLEDVRLQAKGGSFPLLSADPARTLAQIGIWFPDAADWKGLLRFLRDEHVAGEHKRGACLVLAAGADRLSEPVRRAFYDLGPSIPARIIDGLRRPLAGAAAVLHAAMGEPGQQADSGVLAQLLTGARQEREDAALLLAGLHRPEHTAVLVALLGDSEVSVRSVAAWALAHRAARSDSSVDPLVNEGLRRALSDPGARVSLAIAEGFVQGRKATSVPNELVAPLLSHASARVRERARKALDP
jgi:hypothetical protein